jgi:putative transposase
LHIPKLEKPLKVVVHRKFGEGAKILFVVISKTKTNKYFASFCVEENKPENKVLTKETGIDLGLTDLMTFSDETKIANPRIAWKQRKKLGYLQRQHSKKKKAEKTETSKDKGDANQGKNREKARIRLAKCYEKIINQKNDFHHKLTSKITDENQVIVMEDLGVVEMMQNRRLARGIGEVSWYEIVKQLKYKSEWRGRSFVQIDRYFPSSKLCPCGFIHQGLTLSQREWSCPKCGLTLDRDINAAKNILRQGKQLLSSGEGLPSERTGKPGKKQKLKEALLKDTRRGKNKRVYELRGPRLQSGE